MKRFGGTSTRLTAELGLWRRSVCALLALEAGVQLRVDAWGPRYVGAKNRKSTTDDT